MNGRVASRTSSVRLNLPESPPSIRPCRASQLRWDPGTLVFMQVPPLLVWHMPSPIWIQHLKGCTSTPIPSNPKTSSFPFVLEFEGGRI